MGLNITLAVLTGIVLLLFAIGMIRISVTVRMDTALSVYLKIFCFTVPLVPGKKKKLRLRDFEIKRFRRRRKKEKEKELRRAEKKKRREEKQKKKKSAKEQGEKKAEKKKFSLSELPQYTSLAKKLVGCLGRHARRDVRIRISLLEIRVGSGDAAKTAELFGVIAQSASYLLTLLDENLRLELPGDACLSVSPDFLSEKTEVRLDCTVWLRVHNVISLLFGLLRTYLFQ